MEEPVIVRSIAKKTPWFFFTVLLLWIMIRESAETRMYIFAPFLFVMAFLISYLVMPLMILLGHKAGILDAPDSKRKTHTHAIPRTGGIGIFLGFSVTMILCGHFSLEMKSVLIGGTVIFITGVIDDYRGLPSLTRLIVQLSVSVFLIAMGVHVTFVPYWIGGIVTDSLITCIWIIGITNAMNFIDGMDGLAGGMSVIFSTFFALISFSTKQYYFMYLALALAGSSFGFLPFNFRRNKPARLFLGDAGSTFIGFTLASSAILGEWGDSIVDLAVPVIILSILIFDMALTTIVRIAKGEVRSLRQWLAYTGRDHVHHRIDLLGLGKRKTVYLYYCIAFGFGLTSLIIVRSTWAVSLIAILQSVILLFALGLILVKTTDSNYIKFINNIIPFNKKRFNYEKNKNLFKLSEHIKIGSDIHRP